MSTKTATIGELEGAVLESLWEHGEMSTPVAHQRVGLPRKLAYTTVLTVLQRLVKKGLVTRREAGRTHVYRAALSREEFEQRRGVALAATLSQLGEAGMVAFLAETERADPKVFEALRARLESRK